MTSTLVLDASALLAIALDEPGAQSVMQQMREAEECYIHAVNAFEVASKLMIKTLTEEDAWSAVAFGGARMIDDAGGQLGKTAAKLKYLNNHLSLGDCFCLALGEDLRCAVVTSDGGFAIAKTSAQVVIFR